MPISSISEMLISAVCYTVLFWWLSTGLILYLDGLPRGTHRWSLLGANAVLVAALFGLTVSRGDTSAAGAYLSFSCAILVWGWLEINFLIGKITGPRTAECPAGCSDWQRFIFAVQTLAYHEIALLVAAGIVSAITWDAPNQIGFLTYAVLWGMRTSAKLNMFLGVRNHYETFLPEHLSHLKSYFARKPVNLLFPVSVAASLTLSAFLWEAALANAASAYQVTGFGLVATLASLALLEHIFLVIPLRTEAMWNWAMQSRLQGASLGTSVKLAPATVSAKE
jgi:putative photosynthetic complex assembly protein 2